jgi:hypothetical protein
MQSDMLACRRASANEEGSGPATGLALGWAQRSPRRRDHDDDDNARHLGVGRLETRVPLVIVVVVVTACLCFLLNDGVLVNMLAAYSLAPPPPFPARRMRRRRLQRRNTSRSHTAGWLRRRRPLPSGDVMRCDAMRGEAMREAIIDGQQSRMER